MKKSRPPAVTKIFMPDFRHAHTLQQSLESTEDVLCPRVDAVVNDVFAFYCLLLVVWNSFVLVYVLYSVETRGGTRGISINCCSVWA